METKDIPDWDGEYNNRTYAIRSKQHEDMYDLQYDIYKVCGDKFRVALIVRLAIDRVLADEDIDKLIDDLYETEQREYANNNEVRLTGTSRGLLENAS